MSHFPSRGGLAFTCAALFALFSTGANAQYSFSRYIGDSSSTGGNLSSVSGVAIDANGDTFVSDWGRRRVVQFDSRGNFVKSLIDPVFGIVSDLNLDSKGNLYLGEISNLAVNKYAPDGTYLRSIGDYGLAVNSLHGLTLDASNNLYTTGGEFRLEAGIREYAEDGTFLRTIGNYGGNSSNLGTPIDIAVDNQGSIFVVDSFHRQVTEFGADGTFIRDIGNRGSSHSLVSPTSIVADKKGHIFVSDNFAVVEYGTDGTYVDTIHTAPYSFSSKISIDSIGSLYVFGSGGRVAVFTQDVPEPGSVALLMGASLAGAGFAALRRRRGGK